MDNQMETILVWYYFRYDLAVIFRSPIGQNRFRMAVDDIYGDLLTAIDMAKLGETLTGAGPQVIFINFGLKYDGEKTAFDVSIPVKRVNFRDIGGKLVAEFDFKFTVYKLGTAEKDNSPRRAFTRKRGGGPGGEDDPLHDPSRAGGPGKILCGRRPRRKTGRRQRP